MHIGYLFLKKLVLEIETHRYHKRCNWSSNHVKTVNLRRDTMHRQANFVVTHFSFSQKIRNDDILIHKVLYNKTKLNFKTCSDYI